MPPHGDPGGVAAAVFWRLRLREIVVGARIGLSPRPGASSPIIDPHGEALPPPPPPPSEDVEKDLLPPPALIPPAPVPPVHAADQATVLLGPPERLSGAGRSVRILADPAVCGDTVAPSPAPALVAGPPVPEAAALGPQSQIGNGGRTGWVVEACRTRSRAGQPGNGFGSFPATDTAARIAPDLADIDDVGTSWIEPRYFNFINCSDLPKLERLNSTFRELPSLSRTPIISLLRTT